MSTCETWFTNNFLYSKIYESQSRKISQILEKISLLELIQESHPKIFLQLKIIYPYRLLIKSSPLTVKYQRIQSSNFSRKDIELLELRIV